MGLSSPVVHDETHPTLRLVSNFGAENDSLERLIRDLGLLGKYGVEPEFIKVQGPLRNLEALERHEADVCVLSGLNPLGQIAKGSPTRIIGSAMKVAALSVFARAPEINCVGDLVGRSIGIGPRHYLLHMSTIALLRKHGISDEQVRFVEIGSNAQVLRAVASGAVDAGPSSVAALHHQDALGLHALNGSRMWQELPDYTNQIIYASQRAIAQKRDAVVRALAAFSEMFGFLQSPRSWDAYAGARASALPDNDLQEAETVWRFMQEHSPYGDKLEISAARLRYMQELHVSLGVIDAPVAEERVADMSLAREALTLIH